MPDEHLCCICGQVSDDEILREEYYIEGHPETSIGPFCTNCIPHVRMCTSCYRVEHRNDMRLINGNTWKCVDCSAGYVECHSCGNYVEEVIEVEGHPICKSCFQEEYFECERCHSYQEKDTAVDSPIIRAQYPGLFTKKKEKERRPRPDDTLTLWEAGPSRSSPNICNKCIREYQKSHKPNPVFECKACHTIRSGESKEGFCEKCFSHSAKCDGCNTRVLNYDRYKTDGTFQTSLLVTLCRECARRSFRCPFCSRLSRKPFKVKGLREAEIACRTCVSSGMDVTHFKECPSCLEASAFRGIVCERCEEEHKECTTCGHLLDHRGHCRVCNSPEIYCYSTKPRPHFHYLKDENLKGNIFFFGLENECTFKGTEERKEFLENLYSIYDHDFVFTKSDASVASPGCEVVTHPMSLGFFNKLNLFRFFHEGMVKSSTCGLHIHVDRIAFRSDLHLYKVLQFVHDNNEFMVDIAGRHLNSYCREFMDKTTQYIKKGKAGLGQKYNQVNLSPRTTVEFRMFAGCINEFDLRVRVEFLHALISFVRFKPHFKTSSSLEFFKKYVEDHNNLYNNLFKYLNILGD